MRSRLILAWVGVLCLSAVADAGPFSLLVTQSPPGPQNGNPANWSGVIQFDLAGSGKPFVPAAGIDRSLLRDPVGLVFRAASDEVLVANRHGNNSADGVSGSISRFVFDDETASLTPNGAITGNGLAGVHQLAISPLTGELFAANISGGVSRFTFDAAGNAVANGTIANGTTRGVAVTPDGQRLLVTTASNVIRQFDLSTGAELPALTLSTRANLHYLRFRGNELYASALDDSKIYRYTLGAAHNLTPNGSVDAASPSSVVFSPDGLEMFTIGHRDTDLIERFAYRPLTDSWQLTDTLSSRASLGDALAISIIPEPGTLTLLAMAAALTLRRRPRS